jgi:hypothetical protein
MNSDDYDDEDIEENNDISDDRLNDSHRVKRKNNDLPIEVEDDAMEI